MSKTKYAAAALAALAVSAAHAAESPVDAFVTAVQSEQDLSKGEFASLVTPADAAKLAKVAKCTPGQPRASESGDSMVVMWDCTGQPGVSSLGVMFNLASGKITSLFVMPAVIVPVNERG